MEFLRRFCAGDVDGLRPLLSEDLRLIGPYHRFGSKAAYLDSLRSDPPEPSGFRVLSLTEGDDNVAIFYDYQKPGTTLTVAQLFKFAAQRISEIHLVFDGRESTA